MKIVFDTEFIEDGRTIDLLSIGMVREDGATYYAETLTAWCAVHYKMNWNGPLDPWLLENVVPHLEGLRWKATKTQIAQEIIEFAGEEPEFWAWYADYDWVVLCQLFGRMIDLPKGWPMYCRDFKQTADEQGLLLPKHDVELDGPEHHALSDAKWLARVMKLGKPVCVCLTSSYGACGGGFCAPHCEACKPEPTYRYVSYRFAGTIRKIFLNNEVDAVAIAEAYDDEIVMLEEVTNG